MQCPETPSCGHAGVVHKQNSWTPDQVRGDDKYIYSLKFFVTPDLAAVIAHAAASRHFRSFPKRWICPRGLGAAPGLPRQ